MKIISWKKVLPHFISLAVFLIVALVYCRPALEGKVLQQSDVIFWKGMAQQSIEYNKQYGHYPLWNTNLYCGMPNYQVAMEGKSLLPDLNKILSLSLPKPASYFFLACLCFYILSCTLGTNTLIAILGSLAYAYSTYNPIILSVGHETKMMAIAYMPGLLAGLLLLYEKRMYWLGLAVTAIFATLEVMASHPQINYYLLLTGGVMTLFYLVRWIRAKDWKHLALALSLAALGSAIGAGNSAINLLTTYEYAKYTMRGGKTLDNTGAGLQQVKTTGLDQDYAYNWSLFKGETVTLFMPDAYGSSSGSRYDENSSLVRVLTDKGAPENSAIQLASSLPRYWGGMSAPNETTSGPVYIGAIICFLAAIGLVILRSPHRWWMLAALLLSFVLAWGKYYSGINDFLFAHLPIYNKFRAPSMSLVMAQLILPMLAVLTVQQLLFHTTPEQLKATFKKVLYATAGLLGIGMLVYLFNDFNSPFDSFLVQAYSNPKNSNPELAHTLINAMISERKTMYMDGLLRAFGFALFTLGILFLYAKKILNPIVATILFLLVNTIDLFAIDNKYLNTDSFQDQEGYQADNFTPSAADKEILKDHDSHYRVMNFNGDWSEETHTSYFHRSLGGYHAAKLRIYQDIIENQLGRSIPNKQVLNMLDARYIITGTENAPILQRNDSALGACWFVKNIRFVNGPVEEMTALDTLQPATTAIIDSSFQASAGLRPTYDSTASIRLTKYDNDYISYTAHTGSNQFAILSEIYYPAGWNAYIDGKKTGYCKVDYTLRGMAIPTGTHTIEFKFEPASFRIGQQIVYICGILFWLSTIGTIVVLVRQQKSRLAR